MKVCVVAKLSVSETESKRGVLCNVFGVSSGEYTSFRLYECVSICAYIMWSCVYVL